MVKEKTLTKLLTENMRDPNAIFNVVVLDMQGVVYRYTETQGIDFVDTITPQQGKEGEEIYERAIKEFHRVKFGEFGLGTLEASVPYQLDIEERLINDILRNPRNTHREDIPCGLEFNLQAARFIFDALERSACRYSDEPDVYQLVVVSSSRISTSRMLLEKCLTGLGLGYHSVPNLPGQKGNGFLLPDASEALDYISFYNMSEFGSKKDPNAWKNVLQAAMRPYHLSRANVTLSTIIEDQPQKCRAAVEAAHSLGYKPMHYNQIKEDTRLATNHTL